MGEKLNNISSKINGYGPILRLITPLMTFLIATLLTFILTDVREVKSDLKYFQVSVNTLDKRVAIIESNRFTSQDGSKLIDLIMQKLPPKWLVDKVEDNCQRIKSIESNGRKL